DGKTTSEKLHHDLEGSIVQEYQQARERYLAYKLRMDTAPAPTDLRPESHEPRMRSANSEDAGVLGRLINRADAMHVLRDTSVLDGTVQAEVDDDIVDEPVVRNDEDHLLCFEREVDEWLSGYADDSASDFDAAWAKE